MQSSNHDYERRIVEQVLRKKHLTPDLNPHDKIIERIDIVTQGVVASRDPWPNFLNHFHATTKPLVIARELLIRSGQTYDQKLVAESERNLRKLLILAVARIIVCRSRLPNHVVLLVVTKDLWSLRLNMIYNQTGTLVRTLDFHPTEGNFLGREKRIGFRIGLSWLETRLSVPYPLMLLSTGRVLRDKVTIGHSYFDRRFLGTRLSLREEVEIQLNGQVPCGGSPQRWCPAEGPGSLIGVAAQLSIGRPLYRLASRWGYRVNAWIDHSIVRVFKQNPKDDVTAISARGETPGVSLQTVNFDAHSDGVARYIPNNYRSERALASASLVRTFGTNEKHDFTTRLFFSRRVFDPVEKFSFDDETRRWFAQSTLPRSETISALRFRYERRPTRFIKLHNIKTFSLSEDYVLGLNIVLSAQIAEDVIRAGPPFFSLAAAFVERIILAGTMLTWSATVGGRYQRLAENQDTSPDMRYRWANKRFTFSLNAISPVVNADFLSGRMHAYSGLLLREDDLSRSFSQLGGPGASVLPSELPSTSDVPLRGYLSNAFSGRNIFRVNLEYRMRPIVLWTMHLGGLVFYDGGSAWGRPSPARSDIPFKFRNSVGIGLRALFPQFDRETLRVDFGFPLNADAGDIETWFSFSFGQAI